MLSIESLFSPDLILSFEDMRPKVETRVVLVGVAGQDQDLLKALQVNYSFPLSAL